MNVPGTEEKRATVEAKPLWWKTLVSSPVAHNAVLAVGGAIAVAVGAVDAHQLAKSVHSPMMAGLILYFLPAAQKWLREKISPTAVVKE